MSSDIYRNSRIGIIYNEIQYINIGVIAVEGNYLSGSPYIKKRCYILNINIHESKYIKLIDLKNIFIPRSNNPHRSDLLRFLRNNRL